MLVFSRRKRFVVGLIVATSIGAVLCVAFGFDLFYSMQLQSSDFLFKATNPVFSKEPDDRVIVIGIDDKSLSELGKFSLWPRSHYAQMIDILNEANARVIVFDVLFSEPAPGDDELAGSIKNAGNVVLPLAYVPNISNSILIDKVGGVGNFIHPLSVFEEGAAALGHANIIPDEDGVVRRLQVIISDDDYQPALALAVVAKYLRRPEVLQSPVEDDALPFAGRLIPISDNKEMIINYTASSGTGEVATLPTVSFVDVLRGKIDYSVFQDKIVLIGATASALGDIYWTPTGQQMNGVEIHANAIYTVLTDNFLKPAPPIVTMVLMLTLALLCGFVVLRLQVLWATLSVMSILIVYFLVGFTFFDEGIVVNMLYPPLAILGGFVATNLYNVVYERSEKRKITSTFSRYVSAPVADTILAALEKGELKLGGQTQEVTVAFADIRGFTGMAEKMPADDLVKVLNAHLAIVTKAVLKYDGMINKFGGDNIMAVWNAPTRCEKHALLAVKAAVDAQREIRQYQEEGEISPRMEFGIGINTGKAVAGNTGSEDRLEYSVIGDVVNTAARLTDATPNGKVWIGVDTFELVKDHIVSKLLGSIVVRGKREPIEVYEVVDVYPDSSI